MGVYRGNGSYSFTGLRGISDIIGILPQSILCIIEGREEEHTMGNILCLEIKRPEKHPTNEQAAFLREINERGGIGLCIHSVDELERELEPYL